MRTSALVALVARMCSYPDDRYSSSISLVDVRGVRGVLHLGDQGARLHLVLLCGFDLN